MDLEAIAETVAMLLGTGAVTRLGGEAARGAVGKIVERVRDVFGGDRRSIAALEAVQSHPEESGALAELTAALRWYAEQDSRFATELSDWAREYSPVGSTTTIQEVEAGRDAYTAGRDMRINRGHHMGDQEP